MKAVKKFSVTFSEPKYNAVFEFERYKSPMAEYGNKSAVHVTRNGDHAALIDTRYDNGVMNDFAAWCIEWLKNNLDTRFEPVIVQL